MRLGSIDRLYMAHMLWHAISYWDILPLIAWASCIRKSNPAEIKLDIQKVLVYYSYVKMQDKHWM